MDASGSPSGSMPSRGPSPSDPDFAHRRVSFGASASDYQAYRPTYPFAAVQWLVGRPAKDVLDLGAGTGLLTGVVRELGHRVIGIEPDDMMRLEAGRTLRGLVRDGRAEAIPLPDDSVDVVVAGQAWHWFDGPRAECEVARVLRPSGSLGLLWNLRDEADPWISRLGEIVGGEDRTSVPGAAEGPSLGHRFGPPKVRCVKHHHVLSRDDFMRLVGTWSYVATSDDRVAVLGAVGELLAEQPIREHDQIILPYTCVAMRAGLTD